jgi:hypothetical protein
LYCTPNPWLQSPGIPSADIAPDEPDIFVNRLYFEIPIRYWRDTDNLDESNSVYVFGKFEVENGSENKPEGLDAVRILGMVYLEYGAGGSSQHL